jgi:cytochrome c
MIQAGGRFSKRIKVDRIRDGSNQPVTKGASKMKKLLMVVAAMAGLALAGGAQADAAKAKALAQSKNCLACHAVDKKLVGPAFTEVAKKYKGDAGAGANLATKVIKGGGGVWGTIPMPPNPVSQDESKLLVDWILSM